jgi:anti-sigma regulatory factor (Ser/Thr protein kinase)
VWVDYDDERFKVIVQDYGIGFEGLSLKDYDVMSAMDHRQTGGFGLYIIRRSMNEIDYQADRVKGNRLTLTKYINKNHLE